jgi:hypothetical protein
MASNSRAGTVVTAALAQSDIRGSARPLATSLSPPTAASESAGARGLPAEGAAVGLSSCRERHRCRASPGVPQPLHEPLARERSPAGRGRQEGLFDEPPHHDREVVSRLSRRARRQGYAQVPPPDAPPERSALVVGEAGVARHPQAPAPAPTGDRGSRSAAGGFELRRPPGGDLAAQVSRVGSRARLARPAHFGLALTRAQRAAVLRDLRQADLSRQLRRARLEPLENAEAAGGGRRVGLHPVRGANEARSVPASHLQRARPDRSRPLLIQREVTCQRTRLRLNSRVSNLARRHAIRQ